MEALQRIWEDAGRPGAEKFRIAALLEGVRITSSEARDSVKQQSTQQVFKPPPRSTGKVTTATEENQRFQLDLVDNTKFVRSNNRNYRFVLVAIDMFNRKLYAEPQENKTPPTTLASFQRIVERAGTLPKEVDTDIGQEFTQQFQTYLESKDVGHLTRDPRQSNALAVVDSAIRTLKIIMSKAMTARKSGSWAQVLQASVRSYTVSYTHLTLPTILRV